MSKGKKKNDRKVLSHAERFWNALSLESLPVVYPSEVVEVVTTLSLENGVKVSKSELVTKKLSDRNKGLNWYDFSIDSLQLSGALNGLSLCSFGSSKFDAVDSMLNYANNVFTENNG